MTAHKYGFRESSHSENSIDKSPLVDTLLPLHGIYRQIAQPYPDQYGCHVDAPRTKVCVLCDQGASNPGGGVAILKLVKQCKWLNKNGGYTAKAHDFLHLICQRVSDMSSVCH